MKRRPKLIISIFRAMKLWDLCSSFDLHVSVLILRTTGRILVRERLEHRAAVFIITMNHHFS